MPFSYTEVTDSSVRYVLAFCLGVAHVILGVMHVVRAFQQVNQAALLSGSRMAVDGVEEIYGVIRAQESSWQRICKEILSILSLIVLNAVFGKLVEHWGGGRA